MRIVAFGVPSQFCGSIVRSVYRWAEYVDLPSGYRASLSGPSQQRARGEAQDGYRKAVQGRSVMETYFERRSAQRPAADETLRQLVAAAKESSPSAAAREVTSVVCDGTASGYGGFQSGTDRARTTWVERRSRVWQDVRRGYRYFVVLEGVQIDLRCHGHQRVGAFDRNGRDLLDGIPTEAEGLETARLRMVEEYPDLYLEMRTSSR